MGSRIEDYAVIGDCHTAALVSRDGSIDWLCLPRFDSGACFAALLGTHDHGRWLLGPCSRIAKVERRYRPGTLVLETDFETQEGRVTVVDCMPPRDEGPALVRFVVGRAGRVPMRMELKVRFDYGSIVPWVHQVDGGIQATAGPDSLYFVSPVEMRGEGLSTVAQFTVVSGQELPFVMLWHPSHTTPPKVPEAGAVVREAQTWWEEWSNRCPYEGPWRDAVVRSLIVLKALTYAPTGGIVAAPTTSLPERLGGQRNWDYRFCWLRDATFALYALLIGGYADEARAWRQWLVRAVAGEASQLNIMYGVGGERRLTEIELAWLPGYEGSTPVRIGNAAHEQLQLDVFGEVMDVLHLGRRAGIRGAAHGWDLQCHMIEHLEEIWRQPDNGIWEVRGPRRHFTHSKVMCWVAVDRMVKAVEQFGRDGPVDHWRALREQIHDDVCARGFDADLGAFVQHYGANHLDACLLMIPLVGFLPANDPRMKATIEAIERKLLMNGFVHRYPTETGVDGLTPGEGAFLPCTFWLADNLNMLGRRDDAERIFERLLALRNDVGLLAEEYDPKTGRQLGNFPQAFTHVALINTAHNLAMTGGPAEHRSQA